MVPFCCVELTQFILQSFLLLPEPHTTEGLAATFRCCALRFLFFVPSLKHALLSMVRHDRRLGHRTWLTTIMHKLQVHT